jgi:asparagine synthase (glutamine-hydrolysing)
VCGIAGIVSKNERLAPSYLAELVKEMADCIPYRGPDDYGVWLDPDGRCSLSHRRLAIIDTSSAGHQPMVAANHRAVVTFNGEIYNFLELKPELEANGESFLTRSDTEVLLTALRSWGTDALTKLDAMFAFGYYDLDRRELLLARDIFGEKPLYYVDTPNYFAFASELHALTLMPSFDARIDAGTLAAFLGFQYVPAPKTIYASARKLPPGCFLVLGPDGEPRVNQYYQFTTSAARHSTRSLDDLADELEALLVTSLRRRLISDVPLGAFLSGGIDSSTIAALVTKKLNMSLKTFSIGFSGDANSEHFQAAETARHLGTDHYEQVLDGYPIALGTHIGSILGEPNGDSSCVPTYLVSRLARETVTVALSGDGGDELFGGYGRYFATVDEDDRKRHGDASLSEWRAGDAYLSSRALVHTDRDISSLMGEIPESYALDIGRRRRAINRDERPLLNVMREFDAGTYLPDDVLAKVDRMSMQHSLEVRAPLLGRDIAAFAMGLAADDLYGRGQGKLVLKRVASRYLPMEWLTRPKRGFGIPMHLWNKETLLPTTRDLLLSHDCRLSAWISHDRLARYLTELENDFHAYRCWGLFILETWLRRHPGIPALTKISTDAADALPMHVVSGDLVFGRIRSLRRAVFGWLGSRAS